MPRRPDGGDVEIYCSAIGNPVEVAFSAEGEAFTEAGTDLVEAVPMPSAIAATVAAFVAEHHVERTFHKRARDRADPEALGRRRRPGEDGT